MSSSAMHTTGVRQFLQKCLGQLNLEVADDCAPAELIQTEISFEKKREIIWELCERNWRYELLVLDR